MLIIITSLTTTSPSLLNFVFQNCVSVLPCFSSFVFHSRHAVTLIFSVLVPKAAITSSCSTWTFVSLPQTCEKAAIAWPAPVAGLPDSRWWQQWAPTWVPLLGSRHRGWGMCSDRDVARTGQKVWGIWAEKRNFSLSLSSPKEKLFCVCFELRQLIKRSAVSLPTRSSCFYYLEMLLQSIPKLSPMVPGSYYEG